MKERSKIIWTGLGIIIFTVTGVWEYIQMYVSYDLPQAMVVMPVVGCLAAVLLRKYSFIVPAATVVMSVIYQFLESKTAVSIILNIVPVILAFLMVGIAGGFLVRVLINGDKSRVTGIICCVLGVVLTFGGSVALFRNPLYPFLAKHAIVKYAEKYDSGEYQMSEVRVYFDIESMEYEGQVVMSDGVVRAVIYHEKSTGKVYDLTELP